MNRLNVATSPYLLQHQNNPVHWQPWDQEALDQAVREDKLLIISIGYSACHWCHVMEHESFENDSVASVMNENFISIKVDREERPDIDQVYMSAVQLISGRGGWPLNCVALPDGRPIWGGTYLPKEQWVSVLDQISTLYHTDPKKVLEYADQLEKGMKDSEALVDAAPPTSFRDKQHIESMLLKWKRRMDRKEGGPDKAPKFPLPNNYSFLLHYGHAIGDPSILKQVELTLEKMALGGIYDAVGGGFSRYSVDADWKVPHFEKMLYDNAQLISLYSQAYKQEANPLYKRVVRESIDWLEREMRSKEGLYYSALDADSEGEEGKFYVWRPEFLRDHLSVESKAFYESVYDQSDKSEWEGNHILLRDRNDVDQAKMMQLTQEEFEAQLSQFQLETLALRGKRMRPGLDDKCLLSWNALAIVALCDAYEAVKDKAYLQRAEALWNAIEKNFKEDEAYAHSFAKGKRNGEAMLDDMALYSQASFRLFEVSSKGQFLLNAKALMESVLVIFNDPESKLFWYSTDTSLVIRTKEVDDNVIPSSNSIMARNLYALGVVLGEPAWIERANAMLNQVYSRMESYGEGYSNWASLWMEMDLPHYELVIIGSDAKEMYQMLTSEFLPSCTLLYNTDASSNLAPFKDRWVEGKTLFYLCEEGSCQLPEVELEKVLSILKKAYNQ